MLNKDQRQQAILDRFRKMFTALNMSNLNLSDFAASTKATEEALLASQTELEILDKEYLPQVKKVAPVIMGVSGLACLLIVREIVKELK